VEEESCEGRNEYREQCGKRTRREHDDRRQHCRQRRLPLWNQDADTDHKQRCKRHTQRKGLPRQILVGVGLADFCGNNPHSRRRVDARDLQIQRFDFCLT
jgi:hypothetical protein